MIIKKKNVLIPKKKGLNYSILHFNQSTTFIAFKFFLPFIVLKER